MLNAANAQAQERPQIDAARAARMDVAHYLAQGPAPWQPESLGAREWRADVAVAADGSAAYRSVQAAIDAVPLRAVNPRRVVIRLQAGVYRERVCVPAGKAPVTLVGDAADASAAVIVAGVYGGQLKRAGIDAAQPCHPDLGADHYGTSGSATMIVAADDFQLVHLTVANDAMEGVHDGIGYPPGAGESGGAMGVAFTAQADRVQLEDVRLIGHQDTFHAQRPEPLDMSAPARVYVHASLIAGDVDFIFGNATLVIADSAILNRGGRRRPPNGGHVLAPSTPPGVALGFLVTHSRFLAEPSTPRAAISLGRAWDDGVARGAWQAGVSPNGQALIRDSLLGPHLALQVPWAASTSRRPFTTQGEAANRMAEFGNIVLGGEPHVREVPSPLDGFAAAAGGTTGGAAALAADVHLARNRTELVAALKPHAGIQRPRIVQLQGAIDLSVDDDGRPIGFDQFRDPAFDWPAFERAYDPATWGRQSPAGEQEQARRRSAARQAQTVVLRVPSNTTLIGLGSDAQWLHGNLMLDGVDNVIVRNIHFADAYDHFPAWDPHDNGHGEWNSEYDNITVSGATHVWIDHCSFDDGEHPDGAERVSFGRRMQHHDGLLDIVRQADFVTVSWNVFRIHDKTTLVGNGDGVTQDEGRLRASFHHNLYEAVKERTPRVRYGRVHVFNNLFVGAAGGDYAFGYSMGIGVHSRLVSARNAWELPPGVPAAKLLRAWGGEHFVDSDSLLNGQPVDLLRALNAARPTAPIDAAVGWLPWLHGPLDTAADVPARVRAGAGAGRLSTAASGRRD